MGWGTLYSTEAPGALFLSQGIKYGGLLSGCSQTLKQMKLRMGSDTRLMEPPEQQKMKKVKHG